MTAATNLSKLLQPALKAFEKDLLEHAKSERDEAGLKAAWEEEQRLADPLDFFKAAESLAERLRSRSRAARLL